jgi:apolipoprotein N-acyltransferase
VSGRRAAALTALGALALLASYAPFTIPPLSFVAVTPAVLLLIDAAAARDPRRAFRRGFWYGVATSGLVLYWMVVALWHFTALAALGYLATIAVLGLLSGLMFWLVVRVRLALPRLPLALVFPVCWTVLEWVVGHLGDIRFPWLGLGSSLADAPVLAQWADLAGARGVTLWLAWCNVTIVEAWGVGSGVWRWRRVGAVLATVALAWGYGAWRMATLPMRPVGIVGLVQPNEAFSEKWSRPADSVVGKLLVLTRRVRAEDRPALIVWPEAALPGYLVQQRGWDDSIARIIRESHTPLLAGGLHVEFEPGGTYRTFNAAFFYDSMGEWRRWPVYEKHYLVPVVERVPFVPVSWFRGVPWLGRWSGGFGRGRTLPVYASGIGRFGVLICYESAFEDLPRGYRRAGADFLVNITNDAWFGRTAAPYQHASHLVLRAIETRMGVARAANSGISELVDPLGRTTQATALERETIAAGTLTTSDVRTLYVRLGDWVGTLCVLAVAGLALALIWIARRPAS